MPRQVPGGASSPLVAAVVVTGMPTDPVGVPLCAAAPCDVAAQNTATVTVTVPGSITIVKKFSGTGDGKFAFDGDLGAFTLITVDGSAASVFPGLAPGNLPGGGGAAQPAAPSRPGGWPRPQQDLPRSPARRKARLSSTSPVSLARGSGDGSGRV